MSRMATLLALPRRLLARLAAPLTGSLAKRLARRRATWQRWMQERHGSGDTTRLTHRNVYIVPASGSLLFAVTLLLMLITAINYQLNLGYLFTFLLGGAALLAAPMTQRNLRGLQLELKPCAEAFVGEAVELRVVLSADRQPRWGLGLSFRHEEPTQAASQVQDVQAAQDADTTTPALPTSPKSKSKTKAKAKVDADAAEGVRRPGFEWINLAAGARESVALTHRFSQRGWNAWPRVRLETTFPLGVFVSWTYWQPASRILVYPMPERHAPPLPDLSATELAQDRPVQAIPTGEYDEVRAYQPGDSQRRIIWTRLAQADQLISRSEGLSSGADLWLDWQTLHGLSEEQRLSRLTAWVLRAESQLRRYGLRLPGGQLKPDSGHTHKHACLRLLALHGLDVKDERNQTAVPLSTTLSTTPSPASSTPTSSGATAELPAAA